MACIKRLKKQQQFLKSKGKDIVCRGLKTIDELDKAKEKEKQIETKHIAAKAATTLSNTLVLSTTETDPFAKLKVLLLSLKV
jgi:hypothetical protein